MQCSVVKSNTSIIAQARFLLVYSGELPLAIAKDFDLKNILKDFAHKKGRKVFI